MKAGQSKLDVGVRVKIKGLRREDKEFNGLTGTVTHPFTFGCTDKGWVGIWLDPKAVMPWGSQINVRETECKIIEKMSDKSNNRLIAEFMGIKFSDRSDIAPHCYINGRVHYEKDLRYHEDWNWLISVVRKIKQLDLDNNSHKLGLALKEGDIDKSYSCVVDLINWYNERGAR